MAIVYVDIFISVVAVSQVLLVCLNLCSHFWCIKPVSDSGPIGRLKMKNAFAAERDLMLG